MMEYKKNEVIEMNNKTKVSNGYIHFMDDWNLLSRQNLERKQGKPKYVAEATLEDELCEGTWDFPCVAWVPEIGKYVGLYGAAVGQPHLGILCYAESEDGINWEKPDLSSKVTLKAKRWCQNQVLEGFEGGPAYYDPYDPDPLRRFKIIHNHKTKFHQVPMLHHNCRVLMVSPNGIEWSLGEIIPEAEPTDSPSCIVQNPITKEYFLVCRHFDGDRRIFVTRTKDWKVFSEPELVMHPQPMDPPLVGFYGMPVFYYENIFIGLIWRIHCDAATKGLPNGAIDCDLTYSYDGSHFNRTFFKPFIERNELGEHGGGCIYASSMLVDNQNKIRFYSGGSKAEHFQNQNLNDAALMLHTMRLDGFMYLATPSGGGSLLTKWFLITGDDLKINVRTPWGGIRAQLIDEKGKPLPGYTFEDCQTFVGDDLFWTPNWNGKSFGGALSDKHRQLELEIVSGEIYAIRGDFEMFKSHRSCHFDLFGY